MPTESMTKTGLFYSAESRAAIDLIKEELGDMLKEIATRRVKSEGRDLVTFEDVHGALREMLTGRRIDGQNR